MFVLVFGHFGLRNHNSFTKKERLYNSFSFKNDNKAFSKSRKYRRLISAMKFSKIRMIKVCLKFIVAINEGQNSLEFLR